MKKLVLWLLVAVVVVFFGSVALADDAANARWNLAKKSAGFVAGYFSGLLFHEAGHDIMARWQGTDMTWSENRWHARASGSELRNIAFAGFGANLLSTELILGVEKIPKDNAYVLGWLAHNITNFLLYPLRNELQGGYGDLKTLRKTGTDTGVTEVGMIAYGLLTAYRVYKNPKFIPYIRATKNEVVVGIGWIF